MATTVKHPLLVLQEIDRRSKQHAYELPQQLDIRITWDGVGFRVGNQQLVAAVGEVKEILPLPRLTAVFGAQRWVKGIANIRGSLLPIMDLRDFMQDGVVQPDRRNRVLVVRHKDIYAGLLVDEVLGLRQFYEEEFNAESGMDESDFRQYLSGIYQQGDEVWPVFGLHRLAESNEFMQVAV
ncbi:MAG: chemotaxis protein CheW [Thiohalomonadaceae bacterium]